MPTRTRSKRRKRYFITLTHRETGERKIITSLAYSRDWVVENVAAKYPNYAARISTTNPEHIKIKNAAEGWRLAPDWERTVRGALGLTFPIKLRTYGRVGNTGGNHRLREDEHGNPYHDIMVKDYV